MQEPQTESGRKAFSLFVARALFLVQPPCWGAWSAHCTCRKQKKKKKKRKNSTQHNHKSGENSQISTVSVQSAWRETSSHLPHRLRLLSVILFLSRSQFVFIVYILVCVLINPFCIESHTKGDDGGTSAFVWHFRLKKKQKKNFIWVANAAWGFSEQLSAEWDEICDACVWLRMKNEGRE